MVDKLKSPFIVIPNDEGSPEIKSSLEELVDYYETNDLDEYRFFDSSFNELKFEPIGKSANFALRAVEVPKDLDILKDKFFWVVNKIKN